MPKTQIIGFFFLGVLGAFGGGKAWAGCPRDPHFNRASVIHVTSQPLQPTYYHDRSTSQIESLWHAKFKSPRSREPGLTMAESEIKTNYDFRIEQRGRQADYCFWVESLDLEFSYIRMDVFISSQYPEGSCEYNAVLNHENQHVAINLRVFEKYKKIMLRALRRNLRIPTRANPISVASPEEEKRLITRKIDNIANPVFYRFKRELVAANAKIDTAKSYRRIQAQCSNWQFEYRP